MMAYAVSPITPFAASMAELPVSAGSVDRAHTARVDGELSETGAFGRRAGPIDFWQCGLEDRYGVN